MIKKFLLVFLFMCLVLFSENLQSCSANNLTSNPGDSLRPSIAIDSNGVVHVVWEDNTSGNFEIYHKMSTDGGTTWSADLRLTWNAGSSGSPVIAIDSMDNIHIVWADTTPGNTELFYKKSMDGGETWSTKRLTWTSGQSTYPAMTIDSNNHIHVVFQDNAPVKTEIFYRKSTNGGVTWTLTKRLTWNPGYSDQPTIATDSSNNIYVVWDDFSPTPGNAEIFFKKSTDGGATWTSKRLTWNAGGSGAPDIAVDLGDVIHVFWMDSTPGNFEIFHKKSSDGGITWATKKVTWSAGKSWHPAVSIDSFGYLHIVWKDDTSGNNEIYYKSSTDGGATWYTERISWNTGSSDNPDIATFVEWVLEGSVLVAYIRYHVVWDDDTLTNREIYYTNNY